MNPIQDPAIDLFIRALDLPSVDRGIYLENASGSGSDLHRRVEKLLHAHESAGDFLEAPVLFLHNGKPPAKRAGESPGDLIDCHELLEEVGEGGCGIVFLAEQKEPVRRRVALKILKPGMDTREVISRFESERQALALMDHPHIAKVFGAGATHAGRPYFVMEFVAGEKMTGYCDRHSLSVRERLELFILVCHAIQHAHQKGIIHRDIKPSNILVSTASGGEAVPKVIDFGIAKAIGEVRLSDETLFTEVGRLMGTPAYMSPEQASMGRVEVDTRADIYGLGVLLHELLTGVTPFRTGEPSRAGIDRTRAEILGKIPLRPSVRLQALGEENAFVTARQRSSHPHRLFRAVRGDLDWIVMKALEKDPARRYTTSSGLADDVARHLANQPVEARPPGRLYLFRKLVVRNKGLAGGSAAAALLVIAALVIVSGMYGREQEARRQAEEEKLTARAEAAKTRQVNALLRDALSGVAPSVAMGRDTTILRDILKRTEQRVADGTKDQPEVEAEVRFMLAGIYEQLGSYGSSVEMLRKVLELQKGAPVPEPRRIAITLNRLGLFLIREGELEEAGERLEASLEMWRNMGMVETDEGSKTLENLGFLRSRQGRMEEAEDLVRGALAIRLEKAPSTHKDVFDGYNSLGNLLFTARRFAEAESVYRDQLAALGEKGEPTAIAVSLHAVGSSLLQQGKVDEARDFLSRAVEKRRKLLQPYHPHRLTSVLSLANLEKNAGRFPEAEALYREVMTDGMQAPDDYNPPVMYGLGSLASMMLAQGRVKEIDSLFDCMATPAFLASAKSIPVLKLRVDLLARMARWNEASALATRIVARQPDDHEAYHALAPLLVMEGRHDAYQDLCRTIITRFGGTKDLLVADRMAKDCLIRPGAVADTSPIDAMTEIVATAPEGHASRPFFVVCKALADYRRGDFASALAWAAKAGETSTHAGVEALAIRALASHHLGEKDDARDFLEQATSEFTTRLPEPGKQDPGENWRDWIIARELLAEARSVVTTSGDMDRAGE